MGGRFRTSWNDTLVHDMDAAHREARMRTTLSVALLSATAGASAVAFLGIFFFAHGSSRRGLRITVSEHDVFGLLLVLCFIVFGLMMWLLVEEIFPDEQQPTARPRVARRTSHTSTSAEQVLDDLSAYSAAKRDEAIRDFRIVNETISNLEKEIRK
jgi:multidrug efflux pump subunit AcrB